MAGEVLGAYRQLWGVVRLRAVWGLSALLLTYRLGGSTDLLVFVQSVGCDAAYASVTA